MKIITQNKKARYDFELSDFIEAGIVLKGTEIKSIRKQAPSLSDSYIVIDDHLEVWAYQIYIPEYSHGNINNHDERRKRKLLLHQEEIIKLQRKLAIKGMSLLPTKMYFKDSKVKIEIALGKGKKNYDKRQSEITKDAKKNIKEFA